MSRHGLRTISAGAALLCAGLTACGDELPTAGRASDRPPLLSSTGDADPTKFNQEVQNACNESGSALRPAAIVATRWGAPGQAAALNRDAMGFPLEGSHYLVVSSGNAERFDDPGSSDGIQWKNVGYSTPCTATQRCDVGGVDLTLTLATSAEGVQLDYRLYSWDAYQNDEFRVYAVVDPGVARPAGSPTPDRELMVATLADAAEQPTTTTRDGVRYGAAGRSLVVPLASLPPGYVTTLADGRRTVTLRFEAADAPSTFTATPVEDHSYDSGALIDNIRVLASGAGDDTRAPAVTAVSADPSPVPYTQATVLTAVVDDGSDGSASRIVRAEYREDGVSQYTPMRAINADGTAGSYGTSTTQTTRADLPGFGTSTIRVRTLCVRGEDARGNVSAPACVEQAIYDPTQGYVVGSGWVISLPGAYLGTANAQRTGRAYFGFSSKYRVGAAPPSGTTRFTFRDGGLEFRSTSYKWLTIAGARAQYKGNGMLYVNGVAGLDGARQGDYTFMLTAVDGQLPGGGGTDRFRIKISETRTGALIYDSQCGEVACGSAEAGDGADPRSQLGGGSVMIKK